MVKPKPAKAAKTTKRSRRFSLVSAEAQQQMYRAVCALQEQNSAASNASGSEVAEFAACLAAGESCPVVLACSSAGASIVASPARVFHSYGHSHEHSHERRLSSATLAAMDALLTRSLSSTAEGSTPSDAAHRGAASGKKSPGRKAPKQQTRHPRVDTAIVCAGLLDAGAEAERDYRAAFRFAALHKLPILYVIANRLTSGHHVPQDLRSIYPEFGIPLFTVDATDAVAAYRVATEALHNARHLRGPSVLEALILPPRGTTADPLQLLTAYMERHGNPPQ
jgi:dehydrogenase E1 component